MKPRLPSETDDALNSVLREWRLATPIPPRFQERVWERIQRVEMPAAAGAPGGFRRMLEVLLPRPQFSAFFLVIVLGLGIGAGSWAAQVRTNRLQAVLGSRYLGSLDPYAARAVQP